MKTQMDARELFERSFKSNAEFEGDKRPKKDAANAKRVATALKGAASAYRFESLLVPEHLLALKAATNVMVNLARVLDDVCVLSKQHFKSCEAARKVKAAQVLAAREAELDAAAAARWCDDAQMLAEAENLTAFFKNGSAWLERRRGGDCRYLIQPEIDVGHGTSDSSCRLGGLLGACKKEPTTAAASALRRYVVAVVEALASESKKGRDFFYGGSGWYHARLSDFEAWRAELGDRQRVIALATGAIV